MAMPADSLDMLTEALRLAELGWRVVPIKRGFKYPPMKSWQQAASSDEKTVRNWWGGLYRQHGVGVATGEQSGVWVLDIDGEAGAAALQALEDANGTLPDTVEVVTGSGGRHLYFRHPGGRVTTNRSQLGAGLDVRGDGGQVLAPPTIHPNGTAYRWKRSPWEVQVATAPAWLLMLATEQERPAPEPPELATPASSTSDSIAAWYAQTTDFEALLARDGWQPSAPKSDHQLWTRPGKSTHDGASAILHFPDGPFVVFSTAPEIAALGLHQTWAVTKSGDAWAYSKFGYYAARYHHGNRSAAAGQLRYEKDGVQRINPADLVGDGSGTRTPPKDIRPPEDPDADWEPVDLAEIIARMAAGSYEPIVPEVLEVRSSIPLFYRSRINSLFGESGGGKTWVALAAILERIQLGERALFLDYEDSATGIAERLFLLGATAQQASLIDYVNPTTGIGYGIEKIEQRANEYGVVVVDSTGEAMAAGGIDPNSDTETARWFVLVKHLCRLPGGPAVIVLDHVPKDKDAPSSYAIGSQRKRAAVTGAAYRVDTLKEPAKGRDGKLKLTVAKDRIGNRGKGSTAAIVDIESAENVSMAFHLTETQEAEARGERVRPTFLMERVSRHLEMSPGATKRGVRESVKGKSDFIDLALTTLIEEGWARAEDGPRGSQLHYVVREYREELDLVAPPCPTVPHRALTVPRGTVTNRSTVPPEDPPSRREGVTGARSERGAGDHSNHPDRAPSPMPANELF